MSLGARAFSRFIASRAQWRLEADVARLLDSRGALAELPAADGPVVAFATFGSGTWHLVLEGLLAHALALRGARPELLICDMPDLPICDERTVLSKQVETCAGCFDDKRALLNILNIPWRGLASFVPAGLVESAAGVVAALDDRNLTTYCSARWPIGEWLHVSACHFLRRDARGLDPEAVAVRRRLLQTAIVVTAAVERWLDEVRPDVVVAESGAHFMWRIAFELARARGIRVVCREIGKGGFDHHIYAVNADCMSPNLEAAWAESRERPLSAMEERDVDQFLEQLPARTYSPDAGAIPEEDPETVRRKLRLSAGRPTAVLFTNVTWDLATAGRDVAFDGVLDWVLETIRLVRNLPDLQLVVRTHPAEDHVLTRERLLDRLGPDRPWNVAVVPPGRRLSARTLCRVADVVLAYCSTAGLEAAAYGVPAIVCGCPHYRARGFTTDVGSRSEYADRLRQAAAGATSRLTDRDVQLARRYVHLFFLRYHIPMGWTTSPLEPPYELRVRSLSELLPERNAALDVVCRGILDGSDVVLPRMESLK